MYGLPKDATEAAQVRPLAWKMLLQLHLVPTTRSDLSPSAAEHDDDRADPAVHPLLSADTYYNLINRDPSIMFNKIKNDSFRTLATDDQFRSKVGEERLVRCLEAFVWRQLGTDNSTSNDESIRFPGSKLIPSTPAYADLAAHRMVEPHHLPPTIDPGTPYVQG